MSAKLAKSIVNNTLFASSFMIIFSAVNAVQKGFASIVDLDTQVARVLSVSESIGTTNRELAKIIGEELTEAATRFGVSIQESGDILRQFGSAGLTAEESLAAFDSTLQSIIATEGDSAKFTSTLAGIYSVLGGTVTTTGDRLSRLGIINDTLVRSFRESQLELDELTQGFRFSTVVS